MSDTVVLDGFGVVVIPQATGQQIITESPGMVVDCPVDGDLSAEIITGADGNLEIVEDGELGIITVIQGGDLPYYTGATEVTPSQEMQTLRTSGRAMSMDITINPIPSNYGLITWNGSVLTVS